uniref:GPI inositol-deacylase n=1 Tax=Phallusia mammillata TaxID=59560 RepID=A0A6F9DPI4_9ASCI|nr:GPI inositol-deacylase [Phallusia mammillata]
MAVSGGQKFFHSLILLFLCIGIYTVRFDTEEDKCVMTYMYEYPQYAKVPLDPNIESAFSKYNLYLYGEGQYFERVKNLQLHGVPVLYIPGHGGSYKQARSIGSVLLWKNIHKPGVNHFNVFTVDLNGELVGFYGGTLEAQTHFLHFCIQKILSLYTADPRPRSVAVVAHSMGGIIARGVFTLPHFDPRSISTIIMLATPNLSPVINVDKYIAEYYEKVNCYWLVHAAGLKDVSIVSIGGGPRDYQVPQAITRLPLNSSKNTYSTLATAVPKVHVSTEHQTIVWCNQLVLVTARFLVDMLSTDTKQLTSDVTKRTRLMNYHFRQNPGSGVIPKSDSPRKVRLSPTYHWSEVDEYFWSFDKDAAGQGTYFTFSIDKLVETNSPNFVSRTDSKREKWIIACKMDKGSKCTEGFDLSGQAFSTPKYRIIHLDLVELKEQGFTQIIYPMTKSSPTKVLDVNSLSDLEKITTVPVPHVFSNLWTWNKGYLFDITDDTSTSRFYYQIKLDGFQNIYQAFKLTAHGSFETQHLRVQVPWDDGQTIYAENSVVASLHSIPMNMNQSVVLHVYSDSSDPLSLEVKVDFFQVLGGIVRNLGVSLPVYVLANIIQTFMFQLNQVQAGKPCYAIVDAVEVTSKPYKVQPFMSMLKAVYFKPTFAAIWAVSMLPRPDMIILEQDNQQWFNFAPLFLFLFATELFAVIRVILTLVMLLVSPILFRLYKLPYVGSLKDSSMVKFILHSLVLAVCTSKCSSFAFLYMFIASFLNVCFLKKTALLNPAKKPPLPEKQSDEAQPSDLEVKDGEPQDGSEGNAEPAGATGDKQSDDDGSKVEESKKERPITNEPDRTSPEEDCFSVNCILLHLWLWLFLFSLPSLGVLIINFRAEMKLPRDPLILQATIASLLFIIQSMFPGYDGIKTSKLRLLSWFKFPIMVLMVVFSSHSLHRAPWFILAYLGLHTVTQII